MTANDTTPSEGQESTDSESVPELDVVPSDVPTPTFPTRPEMTVEEAKREVLTAQVELVSDRVRDATDKEGLEKMRGQLKTAHVELTALLELLEDSGE